MSHNLVVQELFHAARTRRGAAAACFVVALVAAWAFEGPGAVVFPVSLTIAGLTLWFQGRPRRMALEEEISFSLKRWMSSAESDESVAALRHAFRDHFQGMATFATNGQSGRDKLRSSLAVFDRFIAESESADGPAETRPEGLIASATLHRARALFMLARHPGTEPAECSFDKIRKSLAYFERRFADWRILVLPALALRIELSLALERIEDAESDQELLDRLAEGAGEEPAIVNTRRAIADLIWQRAAAAEDETASALRKRSLVHYDAWLSQLGGGDLESRTHVGARNDEAGHSERVIAILADVLDEGRNLGSADRRIQLAANRFLARAYMRKEQFSRALRYYSVLMSVAGDVNPYLNDPEVLREVSFTEAALNGPADQGDDA